MLIVILVVLVPLRSILGREALEKLFVRKAGDREEERSQSFRRNAHAVHSPVDIDVVEAALRHEGGNRPAPRQGLYVSQVESAQPDRN